MKATEWFIGDEIGNLSIGERYTVTEPEGGLGRRIAAEIIEVGDYWSHQPTGQSGRWIKVRVPEDWGGGRGQEEKRETYERFEFGEINEDELDEELRKIAVNLC